LRGLAIELASAAKSHQMFTSKRPPLLLLTRQHFNLHFDTDSSDDPFPIPEGGTDFLSTSAYVKSSLETQEFLVLGGNGKCQLGGLELIFLIFERQLIYVFELRTIISVLGEWGSENSRIRIFLRRKVLQLAI